jgi:hypothetical protein
MTSIGRMVAKAILFLLPAAVGGCDLQRVQGGLMGCVKDLPPGAFGACDPPPPLGYYGANFKEYPTPGEPRTPLQIYRRLLEDGYETFSPPEQHGPVYFAGVYNRQRKAACMIIEAFNGVILQTYVYGPHGELTARNRHTPGPGYPGDPPFADGRYASYCPPAPWNAAEPAAGPAVSARY